MDDLFLKFISGLFDIINQNIFLKKILDISKWLYFKNIKN